MADVLVRPSLWEKVRGCLLGGLLGDAIGAPGEGKTYREIADQLGISMNSVNTLLARALRKLQEAMLRRMTKERVKKHAV